MMPTQGNSSEQWPMRRYSALKMKFPKAFEIMEEKRRDQKQQWMNMERQDFSVHQSSGLQNHVEIPAFLVLTGNTPGDRLKALKQFIFQHDNAVYSQSITLQSCCLLLSVKKDQRAQAKGSSEAQCESAAALFSLSHSSPSWKQGVCSSCGWLHLHREEMDNAK